jgi:hypothetical protein
VVVDDSGEQVDELFSFVGRQRRQQVVLDLGEERVELAQVTAASGGEADDVAATVRGIGRPLSIRIGSARLRIPTP